MKRKGEFTHDIFLSFNGKDTRKNFTDHLYRALTQRGITTFRDDKSLERGEDFEPELFRAIRESWGSIIVISETCAFSRWCLDELVEIMKQREERGHRVYPIFYHVEPSDFRHQVKKVEAAFDKHENDKRYDAERMLGWRVALKEVTGIHGWSLKDQYESVFIEDIVGDISKKIDAKIVDEKEVETMKNNFQMIQAWLVDADKKQYMKEGEAVKVLLYNKLKQMAYDMDDVLDEWNTAILKSKIEKDQPQTPSISSSSLSEVHHSIGGRGAILSGLPDLNLPTPESNTPSTFFHSSGIASCHDIVLRIKKLNAECQPFIKDLSPFSLGVNDSCTDFRLERPKTLSFIDESVVYGRDHDKDALIHFLLSDGNSGGGTYGIPLLAIVGMGGIGKTTLAQLAYNNKKVEKHFHQRIWVCVSDPFDEVGIAKAILEALTGTSPNFNALQSMWHEIRHNINGKRFLLVLDDVWTEDQKKLEQLKLSLSVGCQESRILVTTRNERVAGILGCTKPFSLGVLSDEDGWSIFHKIAFSGRSCQDHENLDSIGKECVKKCKGLPLAIKTLAGLLRFKRTREQWQRILDSPMWQLDDKLDDNVEKDLFSPLLLSYYDLPSSLKQCFSYCAIFPKDHIIEKDLLIKFWMAQGFLGEGSDMEVVGADCFDNLAERSFFQEFEKDEDDDSRIIRCKMHDIVHDFAQLLRKIECCIVLASSEERGTDCHHENVRHLTLINDDYNEGIPDLIYNVKRLRSLLLINGYWLESWPESFNQLTCLRKLDLWGSLIRVLPPEIGSLIHLRYFSIQGNTELVELPEALCYLCNLQTLNIRWCRNLQKLPCGMEKLINLRHLQNEDTVAVMPKGIRRLTCLQTLERLNIEKKGGNESETSFRLADLGNLIHLRGSLEIYMLGDVGEAEVSEAREAPLSTKAGLLELSLYFDVSLCFDGGYYNKEPQRRIEDEAYVLQALEPPQHLQILRISCNGPAFPNWMTSLTSLKRVELWRCYNWESLPPMGKLPYLESLFISFMYKVKKVGEEFLGLETSTSYSSSINHNNIIAFPSLQKLEFRYMEAWEEWEYDEKVLRSEGGDDSSSSSSNITTITVMPKLQRLYIQSCRALKKLPRHLLQSRALQELWIEASLTFVRRYNKETGEGWPSISHIPNVYIGLAFHAEGSNS